MNSAAVPGPISPTLPTVATGRESARELGWLGRIAVSLLVLGGVPFALQGDFSILWYPPFALVGGLLAIRRPRTSIGWLLLACGWGFAIVSRTVHATPEQFAAGTVDVPSVILAIAGVAAGPAVFLMLAALAIVFPSGRLPGGRWGRIAKAGLGVALGGLVLGLLMPRLTVSLWGGTQGVPVRNPIAIMPDLPLWSLLSEEFLILPIVAVMAGAAVSLFARYRRAVGIERQQLRWIAAALVAVVVGVVGGFVLGIVFPTAGQSGIVWLGAALSFPLVPVALGFAVLRYRLYEIDTIINRTLVYGLLTAVLAGASAATITVTRQLFEGLLGPGSDLSIVVSTLVVVSAFEPIKKRIQSLVDRRFKETVDPAVVLAAFVADVRTSYGRPDPARTMRRTLEVAVACSHASEGRLRWQIGGESEVLSIAGPGPGRGVRRKPPLAGTVPVSASIGTGSATIELDGVVDTGIQGPLAQTLESVLREVSS